MQFWVYQLLRVPVKVSDGCNFETHPRATEKGTFLRRHVLIELLLGDGAYFDFRPPLAWLLS